MLTTPSGVLEDAGLPPAHRAVPVSTAPAPGAPTSAPPPTYAPSPAGAPAQAPTDPAVYTRLRRIITEAGLLERRYGYYLMRFVTAFALFAGALALTLTALPAGWGWTALAALAIGFTSRQLGIIGHDAGHLAVFRSERNNWLLGQLCLDLVLGMSFWSWRERHNKHHVLTNDIEDDPDLEFGGLFTLDETAAASQTGLRRWVTRYQAWLFVPIVTLTLDLAFRSDGWLFTLRELRGWRRIQEVSLLLLSVALWASPFLLLGWRWLAIYIGAQWVGNLYLGLVFAPNHKGMPTWAAGQKLPFLDRQVLSSCNVRAGAIEDYLYSGLNYQIEHHLFPSMPRANFKRAQAIVQPFCASIGMPYETLSPLAAYRQAIGELDRCGRATGG
jgi:fatty acid desaturase